MVTESPGVPLVRTSGVELSPEVMTETAFAGSGGSVLTVKLAMPEATSSWRPEASAEEMATRRRA